LKLSSIGRAGVAGGLGSVLGGGKFEDGFVTASFGYMFNQAGQCYATSTGCEGSFGSLVEFVKDGANSWGRKIDRNLTSPEAVAWAEWSVHQGEIFSQAGDTIIIGGAGLTALGAVTGQAPLVGAGAAGVLTGAGVSATGAVMTATGQIVLSRQPGSNVSRTDPISTIGGTIVPNPTRAPNPMVPAINQTSDYLGF
jgi:hypothetical protein